MIESIQYISQCNNDLSHLDGIEKACSNGVKWIQLRFKEHTFEELIEVGKEARKLLGKDRVIGATANTFEDIVEHVKNGVDYIGLGPFRFTTTKQNLSPVLGLEGYREIMAKCTVAGITVPVFAIGGIEKEDVAELMETGISGIAVSGLIASSSDPKTLIEELNEIIQQHKAIPHVDDSK